MCRLEAGENVPDSLEETAADEVPVGQAEGRSPLQDLRVDRVSQRKVEESARQGVDHIGAVAVDASGLLKTGAPPGQPFFRAQLEGRGLWNVCDILLLQ